MSTGWIFYPPPLPVQRPPKIVPTLPAGVDNPPFGILTRLAALNRIREAWDIASLPMYPIQTTRRSFYNPQFDIQDTLPPFNRAVQQALILNIWTQYSNELVNGANLLFRQRKGAINPATLPIADNPPFNLLYQRVRRILEQYYTKETVQLYYPLPQQRQPKGAPLYPIVITPVPLGFIAFQPNAFQFGYPNARNIGFQAFNRELNLKNFSSKPYMRILQGLRGNMPLPQHKKGDAVVLYTTIFDPTASPEITFTPEVVTITLYNPDGTVRVDSAPMTEVTLGTLIYVHQTSVDDALGVYTRTTFAQHFGHSSSAPKVAAFKLV